MTKFIIKKKSAIGQQIETIWDNEKKQWRNQEHYSDGNFQMEKSDARKLLNELKSGLRQQKWVRLYTVTG